MDSVRGELGARMTCALAQSAAQRSTQILQDGRLLTEPRPEPRGSLRSRASVGVLARAPVPSSLIRDLRSFLRLLDHENLSHIAQAQKKSLWELVNQIPPHQPAAADAEYVVMSRPSSSPSDPPTSLRGPARDLGHVTSDCAQTGSEPAGVGEEDAYEEAEPYVCHASEGGRAESSAYESLGEEEEEEEQAKDRAHYIRRPPREWRLCAYLWRRRWLQWSQEWFLIQSDTLLCFRCARDLLPQLELNLRGCRLVLKSTANKKVPQQLKLTLPGPPVQILVLGFSSCQQAEEWRGVLQEVSAGAGMGSGTGSTSSRSGSVRSDSEDERSSSGGGPDPEGPDVLSVLMSCQWQSLRCRVEPGRLSMYAGEEPGRAQYTVPLRGCRITAGPGDQRPYRITLSALGDTPAVLEAASPEQMRRWLRRLRDGADDGTPRGTPADRDLRRGPGQGPPVHSDACQGSGPARGRPAADGAAYSNAFLSGRGVQRPELTARRAGSEADLSAGKRTSFRQSLSVCSERAQAALLSPLLRRAASLRRAPSAFLLEHGTATQKRRNENKKKAGPR